MLLPFSMQTGLSLFKSPFFANWKLHLIGSDAWRQGKTIRRATNPSSFFCNISYSMFSQNWHDPQPYQHQQRWKWKVFGHNVAGWRMICWTKSTKKEGLVYCIFSSIFCEDLSFDRGDRKPGKDPDEDGYKKVKKGENPPSPDSFYGQLHIYWEMEDPCARFSLELLARCRFFFFSSCFPASWIDAAADSPPTTNS